jgi:sulfur relay (sulfurtransferase) complex TusBCD TusD component (DsrE family)
MKTFKVRVVAEAEVWAEDEEEAKLFFLNDHVYYGNENADSFIADHLTTEFIEGHVD